MEDEKKHLHIVFYGQVQGVFFRATARDIGKRLGLTGTVRNMADGSVEVHAQGPEETLEEFVKKLSQEFYLDPKNPYKKEYKQSFEEFDDFKITY